MTADPLPEQEPYGVGCHLLNFILSHLHALRDVLESSLYALRHLRALR